MTRDDIIRMGREAGFQFSDEDGPLLANHAEWQRQLFERFAALVAAAEREAILQMSADNWFKTQAEYDAAIRARSNP
jgi:hypothetical protein